MHSILLSALSTEVKFQHSYYLVNSLKYMLFFQTSFITVFCLLEETSLLGHYDSLQVLYIMMKTLKY